MKDAIARMPPGLPNTATRRASGTIHPAYRWRRSQRTGVVACGAFHFGGVMGLVLDHSAFGFSEAYR